MGRDYHIMDSNLTKKIEGRENAADNPFHRPKEMSHSL